MYIAISSNTGGLLMSCETQTSNLTEFDIVGVAEAILAETVSLEYAITSAAPAYETPQVTGYSQPAHDALGNSSSGIADQNSHYNWGFKDVTPGASLIN